MSQIDKATRLSNFLIDYGMLVIAWNVLTVVFDTWSIIPLAFWAIAFAYYVILETFFGQTIGQYITKTAVVRKDGNKPSFTNTLFRSFSRLFVTIDCLSYLFGTQRGFHDVISATKLVAYSNRTKRIDILDEDVL